MRSYSLIIASDQFTIIEENIYAIFVSCDTILT